MTTTQLYHCQLQSLSHNHIWDTTILAASPTAATEAFINQLPALFNEAQVIEIELFLDNSSKALVAFGPLTGYILTQPQESGQ